MYIHIYTQALNDRTISAELVKTVDKNGHSLPIATQAFHWALGFVLLRERKDLGLLNLCSLSCLISYQLE